MSDKDKDILSREKDILPSDKKLKKYYQNKRI